MRTLSEVTIFIPPDKKEKKGKTLKNMFVFHVCFPLVGGSEELSEASWGLSLTNSEHFRTWWRQMANKRDKMATGDMMAPRWVTIVPRWAIIAPKWAFCA